MKCDRCGWEWETRVENPASCPRCKQYLRKGGEFKSVGEILPSAGRALAPSGIQTEKRKLASPSPGTPEFRAMVKFAEQYKRNPTEEELQTFVKKGW